MRPRMKPGEVIEIVPRPRPGYVQSWVAWAVVIACVITFVVVASGPPLLWEAEGFSWDDFWFEHGLLLGFLVVMGIAVSWPQRLSRVVAIAVLLPALHLGLALAAWRLWHVRESLFSNALEYTPMLGVLPPAVMLAGGALLVGLAAVLVARRRRREWFQAAVMITLVHLLLLGLWMPLALEPSNFALDWGSPHTAGSVLQERGWEIALRVLAPPFVVAVAFTALALRKPHALRLGRTFVLMALVLLLLNALGMRIDGSDDGAVLYNNFLHILIAAAVLAVAALVALASAIWIGSWRLRRQLARAALVGEIVGDEPRDVAVIEIASWLRGPRSIVDSFTVATPRGPLPVSGAHLVAPIPMETTRLAAGEHATVLRPGDRVALHGFVDRESGQPFRDSALPVPGAAGVFVGKVGDERYGFAEVALAMWRPSIAYLIILVVAALPALAGLLAD